MDQQQEGVPPLPLPRRGRRNHTLAHIPHAHIPLLEKPVYISHAYHNYASLTPRQANPLLQEFTPCFCVFHLGFGLVRKLLEDDQEIRVNVEPVSIERAQMLLEANSSYLQDQPDDESKLRKLQTFVGISIGASVEFREVDGSRARPIINVHSNPRADAD